MKRKSSFHNKMLQFRYEHKNFDNTFSRLRKSAEEVNKTLNKMSQNDEKIIYAPCYGLIALAEAVGEHHFHFLARAFGAAAEQMCRL